MDYDATNIPAGYDRARALGTEQLHIWMTTVAAYTTGLRLSRVVDLGCGTGRFTQTLAQHFDADVVGVDPSRKMLAQARTKATAGRLCYACASGEAIPLPDTSADLVFMSMVFHHLAEPARAARECRRLLRDPGRVFVRSGIREQIASYAYVDFFPASRPILEQRLPTSAGIHEVFESAGFRTLDVGTVTQEIASTHAAYADKLAAGGDSILAELNAQDFERGLRDLRDHAARVDPRPVSEPIDYLVFA